MSWFTELFGGIGRRRVRRHTNHLFEVAAAQAENNPDLRVDDEHPLTEGEGLIVSGVKEAVQKAVAPHARRIEALRSDQARELAAVTAAHAELAALEAREHIVGGGSGRERVNRRAELPEQLGDAITTAAARTEHERIAAVVDADVAAGRRRHLSGVSKRWTVVTQLLLFVDVLALFVLMARVESVGFTTAAWNQDALGQAIKVCTAFGFALLGALMLALTGHRVGMLLWQWMHRGPATAESPADHRERSRRMLLTEPRLVLWGAVLVTVSVLAGVTIALRIVAAAAGTSFAGLVPVVAVMIGVAGGLAPVLVAVTTAQRPSPEVVRRDALAEIVSAVNHRHQILDLQIGARESAAALLVEEAGRALAVAERDAARAALPAVQAIKELRARYGYAGGHDRRIPILGAGGERALFDLDDLARIETTVESMRGAVARTHTSTLAVRGTRHAATAPDRPGADTGVPRFGADPRNDPAPVPLRELPRNGKPVGAITD